MVATGQGALTTWRLNTRSPADQLRWRSRAPRLTELRSHMIKENLPYSRHIPLHQSTANLTRTAGRSRFSTQVTRGLETFSSSWRRSTRGGGIKLAYMPTPRGWCVLLWRLMPQRVISGGKTQAITRRSRTSTPYYSAIGTPFMSHGRTGRRENNHMFIQYVPLSKSGGYAIHPTCLTAKALTKRGLAVPSRRVHGNGQTAGNPAAP